MLAAMFAAAATSQMAPDVGRDLASTTRGTWHGIPTLVAGAAVLLLSERRAILRSQMMSDARSGGIVETSIADPANDGRLVHIVGRLPGDTRDAEL